MSAAVLWAGLAVLLLGFAVLAWARRRWSTSGLPRGRLVYGDTGKWEAVHKPLYSRQYGLVGRPDYLIKSGRTTVPAEVKSGPAPAEPYAGHVLQLAAYCLLVESEFGAAPRYGFIRYEDATMEVPFDAQLRRLVLQTLEAMRIARGLDSVERDHASPQRCARCGQRSNCDQRLA